VKSPGDIDLPVPPFNVLYIFSYKEFGVCAFLPLYPPLLCFEFIMIGDCFVFLIRLVSSDSSLFGDLYLLFCPIGDWLFSLPFPPFPVIFTMLLSLNYLLL